MITFYGTVEVSGRLVLDTMGNCRCNLYGAAWNALKKEPGLPIIVNFGTQTERKVRVCQATVTFEQRPNKLAQFAQRCNRILDATYRRQPLFIQIP